MKSTFLIILTIGIQMMFAQTTTVKHKIYLLPGFGADGRQFQPLQEDLGDEYDLEIIEHQIPEKGMSMEDYARMLAPQIDTTQPFSLLGSSLGGMLAMEMNKFLKPEYVFLVASSKTKKEIPALYRFFRHAPIYKRMKGGFLFTGTQFLRPFFEPNSKAFYQLNSQMQRDTPAEFWPRAIHCIVTWENEETPDNVIHIHGTKDNVLPARKVDDAIMVKGASHMLVQSHVEEVSKVVREVLVGVAAI